MNAPKLRGIRGSALAALIGSQALLWGLAPSVSAGEPAWRVTRSPAALAPDRSGPKPAAPRVAGRAMTGEELAARRAELRRAVPDRIGPPRRAPWLTRGKAPLLTPRGAKLARSVPFAGVPDTVRVLAIRVEFDTDRLGSQTSTPDGRFDLRDGDSLGIVIDPPPHDRSYFASHLEAMARYWRFASYGNLVVEYDVYPKAENAAYRLDDTSDYGPWTLGLASYLDAQRFFRDAVMAADQADSIPFGDFDVLVLFHSGSDFQADVLGDSPRDIPTFQIGLLDSVAVNGGAVGVHGGIVMPETENQDGLYGALNGTMAHEFGHTQGLPDLYDINTFFPAVGVWSNMDSGYLLATDLEDAKSGAIVQASGILPVSLDPWCKALLWPDGVETVDPGRSLSTSLRSTQLSNRLLKVPLGADEYLLVENRQADLNGDFTVYLDRDSTTGVILGPGLSSDDPTDTTGDKEYDFLLPGQGTLAWHIDESVICIQVDDSTFLCPPNANPDLGVNSNPDRMGVRLLEADGIRDIGNPDSYYFFGGPFDPYYVGNHTRISGDTNPSTRTNTGGLSHVTVEVTSAPGVDMTLTVHSEWRLEGWPVSADHDLSRNAPTYGSMRHDGKRSVVAAADSLIFAWMANGEPYYSAVASGEWGALPAPMLAPALFADSLFRPNAASNHGAGIVATGTDGNVYALRPGLRTDAASIPLFGWPPALNGGGAAVRATTGPVLAPVADPTQPVGGLVLVGGSDGRVFGITPSDDATDAPRVAAATDTLQVGGAPETAEVSSNLAVGRFTGAGGWQVAYALRSGWIRVVSERGKDPLRFDAHWQAGGPGFAPFLLGADMDRDPDRNLEVIAVDPQAGAVHCFDLSGNELPGWPVTVLAPILGPAAAGDLDGDGFPEIFAVDGSGYAHRWNRNGVEPMGWPVSLADRYGSGSVGGASSPVIGDVDGDGSPEALFALESGLLASLGADSRAPAGWPISVPGGGDPSPLLLSLNGQDFPPNPPGPAWLHLVAGGGFDGTLAAYQLPARADSALFTTDGVSARTPWQGFGGNRRRSCVLEDADLTAATTIAQALAPGSVYCFPNPARGDEVHLAYTLGSGVTAVEIRVLDPAGNEVHRMNGAPTATQNVARIPLQNVRSGVYMVRIEAHRGASTEVAFHKFAVVK